MPAGGTAQAAGVLTTPTRKRVLKHDPRVVPSGGRAVLTTPTRKRVLKQRRRVNQRIRPQRLNDTDPQEGTETSCFDRHETAAR